MTRVIKYTVDRVDPRRADSQQPEVNAMAELTLPDSVPFEQHDAVVDAIQLPPMPLSPLTATILFPPSDSRLSARYAAGSAE